MDAPTNLVTTLFWLVGGLALFLYGIEMMGAAMRKAAGPALRKAFDFVTATRWHGLLTGTAVTALIQSSSATTVMVVGFINAGLMTFEHSVGVILGANIGTTVTPFITTLDLDNVGLPVLGVGFLITFIVRKRVLRQVGWALMGFGMLFFGLMLMKSAVAGYRDVIQGWLNASAGGGFGGQVLAFLVAMAATAIIQSSAATIVMVQALAFQGAVTDIGVAIPLILGAHVGTCVTSLLASLQTTLSARRAAVAHLLFNVIGVLITLPLFPAYVRVVPWLSASLPLQVANCHLLIRLVNACLFIPFARLYGRLITWILPGEDKLSARPAYLNFALSGDPKKALADAGLEIRRIFGLCLGALKDAVSAFLARDDALAETVLKREALVDDLSLTTRDYLIRVAKQDLPEALSAHPALWLHILSDVERIGDHAENLVELGEVRKAEQTKFSPTAVEEIEQLTRLVMRMGEQVGQALQEADEARMTPVLQDKRDVDILVERFLDHHAERLRGGTCRVIGGMIFVELMTNLRRVANHLRNIAASATSRLPEHARQVHRLKEEFRETRP